MLKIERQQRILALMQETNAVTVRDLAQAFSIWLCRNKRNG